MDEGIYYTALAISLESNHKRLGDAKRAYGTWERAWKALGPSLKNPPDPSAAWNRLTETGSRLVLIDSPEYPPLLREITAPPHGIFVKGTLPDSAKTLAIVGTRKATGEGQALARKFARTLAGRGFIIISGLALGIDGAAHEGCIDGGGRTAAVLGNGIDRPYPRSHERLAETIVGKGGALISEYPPGSPPLPYRFLERNRIVSGLSRATLVVEAPENSGALVTARLAAEQGRDVLVIPGPVTHPNFKGSHRLIRDGAVLVTSIEEILENFGLPAGEKGEAVSSSRPEERAVIEALKRFSSPADADMLVVATTLDAATVNRVLSFLVIKQVVKETDRGYTLQ